MLISLERLSVKRKYFLPTGRSLETFGVFNRLIRDIEIHNEGAMEEKKNKASRGQTKTEP